MIRAYPASCPRVMKKTYVWVIVAIVVILVIVALSSGRSETPVQQSTSPTTTPLATESTSPSISVSRAPAAPTPKPAGTGSSKTYSQLVDEYAGRHIQFDMYCQAKPSNVTYKNGVSLLFDNRSGDPRTITIGGVQYSFPGYGYRIITLSRPASQLPATLSLACGASVNVGSVLLQK